MHVLIVGGSDAGISAALRIHELSAGVEVTVVLADDYPNFSICGLPFFLSGETRDWHELAHRTTFAGINLQLGTIVEAIDARGKTAVLRDRAGTVRTLAFDRVIMATGAVPIRPKLPGIELEGVYPLHTMTESFAVQRHLAERAPETAVIVGGGYIGLEMADALTVRGLRVTVVDQAATMLTTLDSSLGQMVEDELREHGVTILGGQAVAGIARDGTRLAVEVPGRARLAADQVLIAVGVRPSSALAAGAGAALGMRGAVRVTRQMWTSVPDMLAAGDCVETWHRLLEKPVYLPLGTTAHKQGRIAGENAIGGRREFAGSLGSQAVKLFDLVAARTGLLEREARDAGFDAVTTDTETWDHKAYYPGAQRLRLRVTGERRSGRLLGAQLVGHRQSDVAKRADVFAAALFHGMTVEALSDLDLTYTPPLGSPWDPVQMAAQAWSAKIGEENNASESIGRGSATSDPLRSRA